MKMPKFTASKPFITFRNILAWQFITFFLSCTLIFSDLLSRNKINVPSFQSTGSYLLVTLLFSTTLLIRSNCSPKKPSVALWKYCLIAFFDVEGNFCYISAFRFTTITSISLLNCATAVFVALLSYFFLRYRYRWIHLLFIFVTLCGLTLLVLTDVFFAPKTADSSQGPVFSWKSTLLGNFLVILGSLLYSFENVLQEYLLKADTPIEEYLSCFGLASFLLCSVQGIIIDRKNLSLILKNGLSLENSLYLLGFTVCLFLVYSLIPFVMRVSSALAMNLSFLFVDFWAIVAQRVLFGVTLHWWRYFAGFVTISGVIGFNIVSTKFSLVNPIDEKSQSVIP